jgi:hypothetical protein
MTEHLRSREEVAESKVHSSLVPIVLETDHSGCERRESIKHLAVSLHELGGSAWTSGADSPVCWMSRLSMLCITKTSAGRLPFVSKPDVQTTGVIPIALAIARIRSSSSSLDFVRVERW